MPEHAPLDPARTALLVMDYQTGILDQLEDAEDLLATAERALAAVRRARAQVGYVRVAFLPEEIEAMPATSTMRARVADRAQAFGADAPSTQLHARIAPQDGDIVVRKVRVGPFSTTDLDAQLRERGVDTLVLAGISTSGVVLSTVRDGADRDYRLIVLSDATADPRADVHAFLTERIFPAQAEVITTAEFVDRLVP